MSGIALDRAVRQTQYGFVFVLAATCPATEQAEGLITPPLDTPIVNLFLAQLVAMLEPDVQAVLVWDGAGFHRANDLICPSNITLVSLPPYSPELNPVENLWHYLRSHDSPNHMYSTVDDLFDAAETVWRSACLDSAITRAICPAPYHAVKCWGFDKSRCFASQICTAMQWAADVDQPGHCLQGEARLNRCKKPGI